MCVKMEKNQMEILEHQKQYLNFFFDSSSMPNSIKDGRGDRVRELKTGWQKPPDLRNMKKED